MAWLSRIVTRFEPIYKNSRLSLDQMIPGLLTLPMVVFCKLLLKFVREHFDRFRFSFLRKLDH